LATGSSDFKARIFTAFIKGVDKRPEDAQNPWGSKTGQFGNCLVEYNANGWVHSVSWSPSGNTLVYVAHDSTICFADPASGNIQTVSLTTLPFRSVLFVSEDTVVAAGHDCNPMLFSNKGGSWQYVKNLDEAGGTQSGPKTSATGATRQMWADRVDKGTTSNETTLSTKHQNAISCLGIYQEPQDKCGLTE